MVRYTVVSTTKEIKELTAGDVSLVIAWLVAAPVKLSIAPEKRRGKKSARKTDKNISIK
jgi:hypothetical protein